MAQVKGG